MQSETRPGAHTRPIGEPRGLKQTDLRGVSQALQITGYGFGSELEVPRNVAFRILGNCKSIGSP
ncbi:hypothetical protein AG1IA_01631 [Rhizoctonia solani AG-1 IA]|uniref:Uncharacterized protein n=1 Tax=Thanatephorus cucumeris (strain AG1-IA) TaxID=983506 RepID=L8X6T0_THACA|nr:hypothetical protein AG1IA_01631 [Rhizoctonia solani AG-1 IA]